MPDPAPTDYEARIRAQIAQYANPEGLLKLGPIYHYWSRQTHPSQNVRRLWRGGRYPPFRRRRRGGISSTRRQPPNRQPRCGRMRA